MEEQEREELQRPSTPKHTVDQQQYQEGEFGSRPQTNSAEDRHLLPSEDDPYQGEKEGDYRGVNFEMPRLEEKEQAKGELSPQDQDYSPPNKHQKFQDKVRQQYHFINAPLHRAPWNQRFFLTSVQNNGRSHPFFKEYFDKPSRQKGEILLKPEKPEIPIEDFYRSSSLAQVLFNSPKLKKQIKKKDVIPLNLRETIQNERPATKGSHMLRQSLETGSGQSVSQKNLLINEFNWVDNFNVMSSKNNIQVHRNYQEFFDRPIHYDVKGYLYSAKLDPMIVYNDSTPLYKNIIEGQQKPQTAKEIVRVRSEQVLQRASKTSQGPRPGTGQEGRGFTLGKNFIIRPSGSTQRRKKMNRTGGFGPWNTRIGLPISTYNERVYPKYKITFDHLSTGMGSI